MVISVASGKGGTGKTTFVTNLVKVINKDIPYPKWFFEHPSTDNLTVFISEAGNICYYSLDKNEIQETMKIETTDWKMGAVSWNDKWLVIAENVRIHVIDLESKKVVYILEDHNERVNSLVVRGDYLISASGRPSIKPDPAFRIWNLSNGRLIGHIDVDRLVIRSPLTGAFIHITEISAFSR